MRIAIALLVPAAAAGLIPGPAPAQEWAPTGVVRLISNQAAGGTTDIMCRLLAKHLSEALKQSVVVENRTGAGGMIGTQALAASRADGHTVGTINSALAANATLMKSLPFDPVKDLQPLTLQGRAPNLLVVTPSLPVRNVQDLVKLARARPGAVQFGSSGVGVSNHFAGEMFKIQAKIDIVHVPYKGGSPAAMTDVAGGHIPMMFNGFGSTYGFVKAGRLRPLAVTSTKRSAVLPEVPTMIESGLPAFEITEWYGLAVPAGTPAAAVRRLYGEIAKVMNRPDVHQLITAMGVEVVTPTPGEMSEFVAAEIRRYREIVQRAKIEIN
jgi:tripartite-type tricarboxylate transporter receptor subunit TctC